MVPPRTLNTGLFPGGTFYWNTCSDTWRKQKVRVSGHWHTAAAFEITDRSLKTTPLVFRCLFVVHVLHTILNVVFVCSTSSGLLSMTFDDISEIKSQIHFDLSFWFADQTVRISCIYLCIYYNKSLQSWLIPKPRWTFSTSRFSFIFCFFRVTGTGTDQPIRYCFFFFNRTLKNMLNQCIYICIYTYNSTGHSLIIGQWV